MSRRFGRNQKRALREQNAALEQTVSDLKITTENYNTTNRLLHDRIRDWSKEVDRLLGSDSAFNELKTKMQRSYSGPHVYSAPMTSLTGMVSDGTAPYHGDYRPLDAMILRFKSMSRLELNDSYGRMIRYSIEIPGEPGAFYAMSKEMLEEHGFGPYEIQWMALEIAKNLAEHVNKR